MIRALVARLSAARAARETDTYTPEELALFRDNLPEGKALRRRRRKAREWLMKGSEQ